MAKFFRKIRLNFLSAGKTGNYLKYAIGEIILVVIGILIAVQVNNWNEQRIINNKNDKFISKLRGQLEDNLSEVDIALSKTEHFFKRSKIIANEYIGNTTKYDQKRIDSLILFAGTDFHLNLNMVIIYEAQSNQELANIESDTLRESIYKLIKANDLIIEREKIINEHLNSNLIPFINKHYNFKNLFNSLGYSGMEKSTIPNKDGHKIIRNQEFENLIVSRVMYLEDMVFLYSGLNEILKSIYSLLEEELKNK